MKRLLFILGAALALWVSTASAQSIFDQSQLLYSTNSSPKHGVNWGAQGPGQVLPNVAGAQPNQFRGGIVYGGVTKQALTNGTLVAGNFAANVEAIEWPRSKNNGQVVSILRAAVGGPYLSHGFDYLFGQPMHPPLTDLAGVKLAQNQSNYWHGEPIYIKTTLVTNGNTISTNYVLDSSLTHAGADYYWSPHAEVAYATKAGQTQVSWRRESSTSTTLPAGGTEFITHVHIGPYFYPITNTVVLVSGIPFQPTRKLYWTKGDFEKTGKTVAVPPAVKVVNFVYNTTIPEFVPEDEVVIGGNIKANTSSPGQNNNGNTTAFTSTVRADNGFINAYNKEGRIFLELLGDSTGPDTKRQLGVEIIEIERSPVPSDVTIELGERITAYADNDPSDAELKPSPISQIGKSFAFQRSLNGGANVELYATRVTELQSDYQIHWLTNGVAGLQWPYLFVRYAFIWPQDSSKYSHYVRPVVADEAEASLTSILLPGANAAILEEQDPSNIATARAKLTPDSRFYTYLDSTQPSLRALLRYNVGDRVAFERVYSWLDAGLKDAARARSVNGQWTLAISQLGGSGSAGTITSWGLSVESMDAGGVKKTNQFTGASIAIPASGSQSQICTVSGISGSVTAVVVNINGFSHSNPAQLRISLSSQYGESIDLMNGVGGSSSVSGRNLVFDDRASARITTSLASGTYLPSSGQLDGLLLPPPSATLADDQIAPRVIGGTVYVGDRLSAPDREIGGSGVGGYLAGYVNMDQGVSVSANSYANPFGQGFAVANHKSIIPVNAIPGQNTLEVWWFRKNAATSLRDETLGFVPTYWPAVIGRYTVQWPGSSHPRHREIVLASNHGSGPLNSFETAGSLYIQNDKTLPGYNPNEEHALLQGGRAWALRDDLNVVSGENYSSHPYVLIEYQDVDKRPNMSVFQVLREKGADKFDYAVDAGLILQAPMPLPLLDKPIPPTLPGKLPHSISAEVARRDVSDLVFDGGDDSLSASLVLTDRPLFQAYQTLILQSKSDPAKLYRFYPTNVDLGLNSLGGLVYFQAPFTIGERTPESGVPASGTATFYRYVVSDAALVLIAGAHKALVSNPDAGKNWMVNIVNKVNSASGQSAYLEVEFDAGITAESDDDIKAATVLVLEPKSKSTVAGQVPSGFSSGWQVAYETLADAASGASQEEVDRTAFYNQITFQDRKGDLWIYRGPHSDSDPASRQIQFYYKTLPGFWYPTDSAGKVLGTSPALTEQPPVGVITPYLRPLNSSQDGFLGDAVYGAKLGLTDANGLPTGDGNSLGVIYRAQWPASAPVMQMAETLTVPKRGLPAIRGQTSMELLYQQSVYLNPANPSVVLHDPTVAKKFPLFDTKPDGSADGGLNKLPSSLQTSVFQGKTYFPRLAPHLSERFYFDPNASKNGSLVFKGEFKNEALGESYLLPNIISLNDIAALKALCDTADPQKDDWNNAIDNALGKARLTVELETFYPNPAKPGTFTSTIDVNGQAVHQAVPVHANELAEIKHSDTAVDSYALTAVGPGTGYVTLIAGQGAAFTPPDEPVSVKIIKVVDTLYRGEVKVILPSNPLGEKVTMQQVLDLAGKVQDFDFEWWIAAPVDGAPPPVYGNTPVNLTSSGSLEPWYHLRHPGGADSVASLGTVGLLKDSKRLVTDVSNTVRPVSDIPFTEIVAAVNNLYFVPVDPSVPLQVGNQLTVRTGAGDEIPALVTSVVSAGTPAATLVTIAPDGNVPLPAAGDVIQIQESIVSGQPQSIVFKDFSVPSASTYSQYYLSLDLDDALGAKVYVDGSLVVSANISEDDTTTTSAPSGFTPAPLARVYSLGPESFSSGVHSGGQTAHRITVELFSGAIPNAALRFNCQLDAYQSVDKVEAAGSQWLKLDEAKFPDKVRTILGENADVRALSDNYVIMRYKAKTTANYPAGSKEWSQWTDPALAEGWIKRVLAGINPFNQRVTDLFNNTVNTDANILTSAGKRWEGDIALNLESINNYGLIEIYETVLRRGKDLSINSGISYDPANDALLLAAGYLSDLYMMVGNEARADAANPTIGIGTKDRTYGDVATALFAFKGQLPSLLEEELALLRGRDDFLQPGVHIAPVYNRLVWNYTRGIDSGEVIYALNYNILDQNNDGKVDAADAAKLYPQGHGDAYGHYLTALKGYYSLLIDKDFAWVPRIEAVNILGKPVAVDYQDERKFAAAAAAVARTGRQVFDLTWRADYQPGQDVGWEYFSATRDNTSQAVPTRRQWGMDHWAARTGEGAYINWAVGNSILPAVDPNPAHEGIQKVDRTTVPDLKEIAATASELQTAMDNAEGRLTPLGLANGSLAFDINPNQITGADPKPHFEQVYGRALAALNNAVASFDDAKDVTRLMRSEQDSLAELQASVQHQEQAYTNALIELYGTPYPDDVGPGKLYKQGYAGPDLFHYKYVETETIEAPGIYTPNEPDYVAKIDIQALAGSWSYTSNLPRTNVNTTGPVDGSSDDLVIVNASSKDYEKVDPVTGKQLYYIPYAFGSHGFFDKPKTWTSSRQSPGKIQQAISELIQAHDRMYYALAAQCESDKQDLDKAVQVFQSLQKAYSASSGSVRTNEQLMIDTQKAINGLESGFAIADKIMENLGNLATDVAGFIVDGIPNSMVFGVATGGDLVRPAPAVSLYLAAFNIKEVLEGLRTAAFIAQQITTTATLSAQLDAGQAAVDAQRVEDMKQAVFDLGNRLKAVQGDFQVINEKLRIFDDTKRKYASLVAQGDRLLQEREIFRQRSAAIVQGFRTRDAAFRIFRNEKLERYKSLFDLSARYTYLAANAYDYETGLLNTDKGREFVSRIINSRALGVVKNGDPQFAGSNLGDPGLSSVLAEMKADFDVLKGRLGFNNPSAYGTTFSLRTEKHRILPGAEGANSWKDVLAGSRKANLLEDSDVRRLCMQIDPGNGLPVPGLVIEFETTIADGYNFFGQPQEGYDHYFDSSAFATKIFAAGVAFEGYVGMDNPAANNGAVGGAGGTSPADPNLSFLDPNALGATPGVYLIPVGLDSMRSPALGDSGAVRTWSVDDVTIPLPFNIGGSDFSSKALYQSSDSLSEPLFGVRKHPSFRPVSTTAAFTSAIYGNNGALARSQFTNTRLIGRSAWNSKWKLVIPGTKLLRDPDEGVRRFINTVTDVKLHLVTYSYSGN